jgi:hypothetical protein
MTECPAWSFFLITSDKEIEKEIMKKTGRKADRRRKLYNGTIETQFYQYHGERPPKTSKGGKDDVIAVMMVDNEALMDYISENLDGVLGEEYSNPYGQGRITSVE